MSSLFFFLCQFFDWHIRKFEVASPFYHKIVHHASALTSYISVLCLFFCRVGVDLFLLQGYVPSPLISHSIGHHRHLWRALVPVLGLVFCGSDSHVFFRFERLRCRQSRADWRQQQITPCHQRFLRFRSPACCFAVRQQPALVRLSPFLACLFFGRWFAMRWIVSERHKGYRMNSPDSSVRLCQFARWFHYGRFADSSL